MPASRVPDLARPLPARPLLSALSIFGSVGIVATCLYFVLAWAASAVLPVSASLASVAAYMLSAVFSYYGHKHLSFASSGPATVEVPRFAASTVFGLLLAYAIPLVAGFMEWPHLAAYLAVCLIVPALNFVLLKSWVFQADSTIEDAAAGGDIRRLLGGGLALACLGFVVQSSVWEMNPDTSWLITVIERMQAGDRPYVDIIELNPPSSVWLYWMPVLLSRPLALSPEATVNAYTLLICLGGVGLTGWIIRAGNLVPGRALAPLMAGMFLAAAILIGNAFSERDHIGVVLLTPLIALAAWRSDGRSDPAAKHWLAAGCAGGMIALVKPYYALVVVAAAAYVVIRRRDVRLCLLPEFVIAGGMSLAYIALFYLAYPVFFEELLPLLSETYMAFSWPLGLLAMLAAPFLAIPIVYLAFARERGRSSLSDLLLMCAAVAWIPYFVQGKGWAYHAYPAVYLGSAAVIVAACKLLFDQARTATRPSKMVEIVGLTLVALVVAHWRFFPDSAPSRDLAAAVRGQTSSPTAGILGGDIGAGHPLARMIGARWIEPYCSDWIATFALRLEDEARRSGDGARAAYFERMTGDYLDAKRLRLEKSPPQILIVDRSDGLVGIMLAGHGFDRLLANYVKIGSDKELDVYRLAGPAGATPET